MYTYKCAAAVRCLNLGRLAAELEALEAAGIDELHFDVADGVFAPALSGGIELIRAAKDVCGIPCHAHLMITRPERHVEAFARAGCDSITVHVEASMHAQRLLTQIRETGASPGIALNPATPLTKLDYLFPNADRVLLLTAESGDPADHLLPMAFERARILYENMRYHEYGAFIEVDGHITVPHAAKFARLGVHAFVLDEASIFNDDGTDPAAALAAFRSDVALKEKTV